MGHKSLILHTTKDEMLKKNNLTVTLLNYSTNKQNGLICVWKCDTIVTWHSICTTHNCSSIPTSKKLEVKTIVCYDSHDIQIFTLQNKTKHDVQLEAEVTAFLMTFPILIHRQKISRKSTPSYEINIDDQVNDESTKQMIVIYTETSDILFAKVISNLSVSHLITSKIF